MSDRYAVIGNPIEHSKSPQIHEAFARQSDQDMSYERLLGDMEEFEHDVRDFFAAGGRGLNVTVPFKERAWAMVDELSERAERAAAVNTLIPTKGGLRGENTDGVGLITDLGCNHFFDFHGAAVLLLGAGGAARGVIGPLMESGINQLQVANRTADKAETLADQFSMLGEVDGCGLDELGSQSFDLIVNATAASLKGEVPAIPESTLSPDGWVYDMMYADQPTAFMRWGAKHGAGKTLDGLGMLVEQAAEAFYLWRNVRPDTEAVIQALRP